MSKVVNIKTLKKQAQKKKKDEIARLKEEQLDELSEIVLDAILFYCSDKPYIEPEDILDVLSDVQNAIELVGYIDDEGMPDDGDD